MGVTRRDFIKIAGAVAGGGLGAGRLAPSVLASRTRSDPLDACTATVCEMCHWYCGAIARVVDGKVVKLDGNPNHPNSRGKLCARGNAGIGLLYDPDRVKTPLIRAGARGDGKYRKASWDEALNYIAEKMEAIKKAYGPEAVCLFSGGGCSSHLIPLMAAFGSPNFGNPAFAQCRGPRDIGFQLTFGEYPGAPERLDLANSKVIVLFGSHLGENMHNSQVQDFAEAVGGKAKLIVVDPRFSTAAGKAEYWLPIRPGTDMALMLAWTNILAREGLYDRDYVERYATGFEELAASVAECTPEWAEKETDIPAGRIVETAIEIGTYKPAVCIHPGRHASWYGNDVQRSRALAILTAILGSWGREGGFYLPAKASLRKAQPPKAYPLPGREALMDLSPYPLASRAGLTNGITNLARAATLTGKPYPIKGWIVMGTNIVKALPNEKETLDAINNLDLLVTAEILPLDTAMLSDVILPSASYLEQFTDLAVDRGRHLGVCMGKAAVKPLYESRDGYTIARELAKKLNLADYFPWETLEDKIKAQCGLWKIDYEELGGNGYVHFEATYGAYITPQNQPVFKTPSGKIELYSKELEKHGFDPIPKYIPVQQPEEGYFRLLYGRSPVHSFSRSTNNPLLAQLYGENEVWINARKAEAMGIKNGRHVVLVNQDGVRSNRVKAKVTQRIREDCVYMVHGFCSSSKDLRNAYRKGADDQGLITRYAIDPICGSTGMRVNFVKVAREV
ncbi:MAG: molybdopterin-dependent oxidoreductase [Syntrophobacteraceae bacterium]